MSDDIKILVFLNDDDEVKTKTIYLLEENEYGIKVQFYDIKKKEKYGAPFFLPWHMVKKIKDRGDDDGLSD